MTSYIWQQFKVFRRGGTSSAGAIMLTEGCYVPVRLLCGNWDPYLSAANSIAIFNDVEKALDFAEKDA